MTCEEVQWESYNVKSFSFGAGLAIQHKPGQYATFEIEVILLFFYHCVLT